MRSTKTKTGMAVVGLAVVATMGTLTLVGNPSTAAANTATTVVANTSTHAPKSQAPSTPSAAPEVKAKPYQGGDWPGMGVFHGGDWG